MLLVNPLPKASDGREAELRALSEIKVADFGFACLCGDAEDMTKCCGTPYCPAPPPSPPSSPVAISVGAHLRLCLDVRAVSVGMCAWASMCIYVCALCVCLCPVCALRTCVHIVVPSCVACFR